MLEHRAGVVGVGALGYLAYDLATGGAERIADSADRLSQGQGTTGDYFAMGNLLGGAGAGSGISRAAISGASRATASLNAGRMATVDLGVVLGTGVSLPMRVATTRGAPRAYSTAFETTLNGGSRVASRRAHISEANQALYAAMQENPGLAAI